MSMRPMLGCVLELVMNKLFAAVSVIALSGVFSTAASATTPPDCGAAAVCTVSQQHMGDTAQQGEAGNTGPVTTTQAGVASATNQSGDVTIAPDVQTSGGTANTESGPAVTQTGDIDSRATGNISANDVRSGDVSGTQSANNANGDVTGTISGKTGDNNGTVSGKTGDNNGTISGKTGDVDASNKNANMGVNLSSVEGRQDQQQAQKTAVANGSESKSASSSGGNVMGTELKGGNNAAAGNKTETTVDASTKVDARSIFVPAIIPVTPSSTVAVGNIIKETTTCGPLQAVVKTPVYGSYNGLLRTSKIDQGFTYDLKPYLDVNGAMQTSMEVVSADGVRRVWGHQAIIFSTVIGLSSNRNIALGGGGETGAWGQGGMGSSSSNTRLVTNIQLKLCELGHFVPEAEKVLVEEKPIRQ